MRSCSTAGASAKRITAASRSARASAATGWWPCRRADAAPGDGHRHRRLYGDAVRDGARGPRHDAGIGDVLVTGAAGGVGSVAIALLSKLGFRVIASTGRLDEAESLKALGAAEIIDRAELSAPGKPLAKERWAGVVDAVGSHTLANACAGTNYRGAVAACGLAQGMDFPAQRRAVHPARRHALRHRQRDGAEGAARAGLGAAGARTWTRPSSSDDARDPAGRRYRCRGRDPGRAHPWPVGGERQRLNRTDRRRHHLDRRAAGDPLTRPLSGPDA